MAILPDTSVTFAVWIGVFGKLLVKNGTLKQSDIVAELESFRSKIDPNNPYFDSLSEEIDSMIAVVGRW